MRKCANILSYTSHIYEAISHVLLNTRHIKISIFLTVWWLLWRAYDERFKDTRCEKRGKGDPWFGAGPFRHLQPRSDVRQLLLHVPVRTAGENPEMEFLDVNL